MRMLDSEFLLLVSTVDPPSLTGKKLTPSSSNRYFLITPKLLTGLRYDERMKVLCINNGTSTCAVGRRIKFLPLTRTILPRPHSQENTFLILIHLKVQVRVIYLHSFRSDERRRRLAEGRRDDTGLFREGVVVPTIGLTLLLGVSLYLSRIFL